MTDKPPEQRDGYRIHAGRVIAGGQGVANLLRNQ